jgi:prevent-host-death family protein
MFFSSPAISIFTIFAWGFPFQLAQGSELYKTRIILYTFPMSDISISDARENLSTAVSDSRKKPVRILKHGKPVAVLINPSLFEKFVESMEELEDIAAFDEAISDKSADIPWLQVKRDLGIA